MSDFYNDQVKKVSEFLQNYMKKNNINSLTADQCATLLAENEGGLFTEKDNEVRA